ncbi:hypothetical protein [Xenophilus sp. Marseille-Q4582]|uniref:hypothetical protein n=1 Tax=Xenophilus sp. Marseille-Q4582 TaxID=2866600 RepID=UPI001CE43269|nr:hypothetical protein [Xenophilus sp. Marseille-Q4582]
MPTQSTAPAGPGKSITATELAVIHERLDAGDSRMQRIEERIDEQAAAARANAESTAELVEMFKAFQGAFRVLQYFGKLAKPLGAIVALLAAVAGLWTAAKGGGLR